MDGFVHKWILTGLLRGIDNENDKLELSNILEECDNFLAYQRGNNRIKTRIPDGIFNVVISDLYKIFKIKDYKKIYDIFTDWYDKQDYSEYIYSNNKNGDKDLIYNFEKYYFSKYG